MNRLPIHTAESAPAGARETLQHAEALFGFLPNLLGKLANAPAALDAYLAVAAAFERSSLTPIERQIVLLTASVENRCQYCGSAHSFMASRLGADDAVVEAVRRGSPIGDARLEALRRYTQQLVRCRGQADQGETQAFLAAGFDTVQIYDVITGIAQKTISNYADHVEAVPLDAAFSSHAWSPPGDPAPCA